MVVALLIVVVGPDHSRPVWAELWFCVLQKYHVFQCRNGQDFMGEIFCMFTSDCEKRDDEVTIYMSKIVGGLIQRA